MRFTLPEQAEGVAAGYLKIDACAQSSSLDPASVLGGALVLEEPLLLSKRDALLLLGLVVHGHAVLFRSLIEAVGLFKELDAIRSRWYVQLFEEHRNDCDTVSVKDIIAYF